VNFDFYTPIGGIQEDLWLNWQERDAVVLKLIKLKRQYGNFLLNSRPILELMLSKNSKRITSNYLLPKAVICLDAMGNRKLPCVIGKKADCLRCGCMVPFSMESIFARHQIRSFPMVLRLFFQRTFR
jgi:Fe-coproporphyrin III synthase